MNAIDGVHKELRKGLNYSSSRFIRGLKTSSKHVRVIYEYARWMQLGEGRGREKIDKNTANL